MINALIHSVHSTILYNYTVFINHLIRRFDLGTIDYKKIHYSLGI